MGQTTAVSPALMSALLCLTVTDFILDGEYEPAGYQCWDILAADGVDLQRFSYRDRYDVLEPFGACPLIKILPVWRTTAEKQEVIADLRQRRAEGIVFKDSTAPYVPGRSGQHYKLKFEKTATVRVRSVDPVRNRAQIEMLDGARWREVSGIKIQNGLVRAGDYIEVRYLSASENKRLVQPVFLRLRTDVCDSDCSTEQLEFSGRWASIGEQ